jgi:UDP-N-acetylglucosamine transferase subunit ALG13
VDGGSSGPVLLVASTGGHLAQLHRLSRRLSPGAPRAWVTFDTPQSRRLLDGEHVSFVPYTAPRDYRNVAGNLRRARRILDTHAPSRVVSTGAGIALSFLPLARAMGIPATYIESAARSDGPSLTGRLLERVPGVRLHTQYPSWQRRRWTYVGSVFDSFETGDRPAAGGPLRVVVSLGTIPFGFSRLLAACVHALPQDAQVTWQTGETDASALGIDAQAWMPPGDLAAAMAAADVVVAHAGIGSALAALEAGRCPILVPREAARGEHVDDHQRQIAVELDRRGLALHRTPETLDLESLRRAAAREVTERASAGLLPL